MKNSLNESDYDELETCLSRFKSDRAMNLEEVDGFFTALICSPEITPPSVYLNEIWGGGEMPDDELFNTSEELQRFINLIMSHWNIVVKKLSEDEVFLPVLLEESRGTAEGNDWAKGFIRGT
ncbi:MAG TPA: YecA family protein, partial [Deltaproteobacteria bacterium]|nr:YecA family protein [Deltaproteobacteria bacterium]